MNGPDAIPEVSVVIPTFNRSGLLLRCLRSLACQDYGGTYEVLVVDDGSPDDTRRAVEGFCAPYPLRYLRQENRGPAAARNLGIARARGKRIAFLDDDHIASPAWLAQIANVPARGPVVGLCGRNRSLPSRTVVGRYAAFVGLHERPRLNPDGTVEHLMSGNAALRAEVLREAGGFDGRFTAVFRGVAPGGEDTALSRYLQKRGWKLGYNPDAVTDHRQKERLVPMLQESFNFGCNRALWQRLQGRPVPPRTAVRRLARAVFSLAGIPLHAMRFRRQGLPWLESLAFAWIQKLARVVYEAGDLLGAWRARIVEDDSAPADP